MAVELATAYVSLVPSAKGITGRLQQELGAPIEAEGKRAGGRFTAALGTVAKRGIQTAGAGVAATFGAALVKGFGRLRAIDDARFKLQGLGHDAKAVDAIMESALDSVKGTAFGLGEAATIAAGAVAAGIKPGEELTRVLSLTGDAAQIAGTSLAEMGAIFGKVAASDRMMTREMQQLQDRGLPVLQWLQEETGKSAEAVSKMVSEGKVDLELFSKIVEDNIGGAALKGGESFRGALANVGAALGRFGATVLSPIFEAAKDWFVNLQEGIDAFGKRVGPLAEQLSTKLVDAVAKVHEWFGRLSDWWASNGPTIMARVREFADRVRAALGRITAWWAANGETVIARVGELASAVRNVLGGAFDFLAGLWDSLLYPALSAMRDLWNDNADAVGGALLAAYDTLVGALETVGSALSTAGEWMRENAGLVQGLATAIGVVLTPKLVVAGVAAVKSAALQVGAWAATAARAVWSAGVQLVQSYRIVGGWAMQSAQAIRMLPFVVRYYTVLAWEAVKSAGTVVVNAARVVGQWALMAAQSTIHAIRMAAAWTIGIIGPAARAAIAMTVQAGRVVAQWVLMGVQSMIHAAKVAAAWVVAMGPVGWVTAAVVGLVALIVANWDTVVEWTRKAWDWVTEKISDAWRWVQERTAAAVAAVVAFVVDLRDRVVSFITNLRDRAVQLASNLRDRIVEFFGRLRDRAVEIATGLRERVVAIFTGLRDSAIERIRTLIDRVKRIKTDVINFFRNAKTWLRQAGRNIITGLIDGIKSMGSAVGEAMRGVADRVSNFLPWSPAKEGPLRSHPPEQGGANIVRLIAAGMLSEAGRVASAAELVGSAAVPSVGASGTARAGTSVAPASRPLQVVQNFYGRASAAEAREASARMLAVAYAYG